MVLKWGEVRWGEVVWGARKWNGEGYLLDIYRGEALHGSVRIDEGTRLIRQLLGEDIIRSTLKVPDIIDIQIGDYTVWEGIRYYINALPNIKKNSTNSFDYDITFESQYYELLKTQFLDLDENSDFYLVGNLGTFIKLIVDNMERKHTGSGWTEGTWDKKSDRTEWPSALEYKLLSFSRNNCMQVLQRLCGEFEGEFYFDGKKICFTDKTGSDSGETFKYHLGLRNIARQTLSEKNIITRLYAFGSKKNLKSDYRDYSRRLKFVLPTGESYLEKYITATTWAATTDYIIGDIIKALIPNKYYYECTTAGTSGDTEPTWGTTEGETTEDGTVFWTCRVDPADKYGVIEHTKIFEDIYPHRTGTISSVDAEDITKFIDDGDNGMDFNLNECLLPGVTAKVHFNSGALGGYEFEISNYNHADKEFTIIKFTDDQGYVMPNDDADLKPGVGDKYVLIDIFLPPEYITAAENTLQAKAQAYLNDNCNPRVNYLLTPDWRHFKANSIALSLGDSITIEDTDLNINSSVRIVELTRTLINAYKYTLKLSDHPEPQLIQRLYSEQEGLKEKIEIGEVGDIIRSRRSWRTSEELRTMVFDIDGKFDIRNIRASSITADRLNIANLADIANMILGDTGYIRTTGKVNYASDVAGIWMGYDVNKYKLNIGSLNNYIKWDGSALQIKGRLNIGAGTDEDIYFEDSEIRMYDWLDGDNKQIYWKFLPDNENIARLTYNANTGWVFFDLYGGNYELYMTQQDDIAAIRTTAPRLILGTAPIGGVGCIIVYETGQLLLHLLPEVPTVNNWDGSIAVDEHGLLHNVISGSWNKATVTSGW